MGNATRIKKADKVMAVNAMTKQLFQEQRDELERRRSMLAERIYRHYFPTQHDALHKTFGRAWPDWVERTRRAVLPEVPRPIVKGPTLRESGKQAGFHDLFSGVPANRCYMETQVDLPTGVPVPKPWACDFLRGHGLHFHTEQQGLPQGIEDEAKQLGDACRGFNHRAASFHDDMMRVFMGLTTVKQFDERFPEAWQWLPASARESTSTIVPQQDVDAARERLKQLKRDG